MPPPRHAVRVTADPRTPDLFPVSTLLALPDPESAEVVHEDDLAAADRYCLVADRYYRPLRPGVLLRADLEPEPRTRAESWRRLVPVRGAVALRSAVWVHAGGPPPERLDLVVPSGSRRPDPDVRRRCFEAPLAPRDLHQLGGVAVTSLVRTGLDVACLLEPPEADALLHRLTLVGFEPRAALGDLSGWARPGVRQARRLLRGVRAEPVGGDRATGRQARMTGSAAALDPVIR